MAPSPAPSQRYIGGAEIARGGMGRVIEATDTLLARTVAVKEALTSDPETLRRFARETRITARLEHPSIVPVYDAGIDPSAPFYVMRRVTGRPLSGLITAAESLDERLALVPHVLACAQAIAHAHKRGVIHRDIKPSNILVGELGETVVIDWGIAKVIGESDPDDALPPMAGDSLRTRIGTVSGTPGFMAPEQALGDELGPSADVWALGATLYFVLSRQMPHEVHSKTPDDLLALAAHRPVPPIASIVAGVPPDLAAITARALAFKAGDRFPDAATFAEELSRFLTGQIVASHRYSMRERIVRWVKRHRAIVAIAVLSVSMVAVVSTIAIGRVIAARERADESARLAEVARAKEELHAQTELLARGRAIATTHPVSAIAAIDQLPASSPLAAEADAVFATAITHGGAAWALTRNSGQILALELDPTGSKVLQMSRTGVLQVWDLDRRELVLEQTLPQRRHTEWISRGVVIYGGPVTELLDPTTKKTSPFGTVELTDIVASSDGTRAAGIDNNGAAGWIDVATGALQPIATADAIEAIAMPADGGWLATYGAGVIVVYDPAGTELLRRAATQPWMIASRSKRLAVYDRDTLAEVVVGRGASWHEIPRSGVVWPHYLGETLTGRSPVALVAFVEGKPFEVTRIGGISTNMVEVGDGMIGFTTGSIASELVYFDGVHMLEIPLPEAFNMPRIVSRPGSTRVVIASNAMLLVLDLGLTLPRRHHHMAGHKARFVTDRHILSLEPGGLWVLHEKDKRAVLEQVPHHAEIIDVAGGRVLFANNLVETDELFVVNVERLEVFAADGVRGRLIEGGVLYVGPDSLWIRRDNDPHGTQIAKLPGTNDALIVDHGSSFFVFSGGELLRGTVKDGVIERRPFALPERGAVLVIDGRLLVANDKELRWDSIDGPLIGTLEDTVIELYTVPGGFMASLASGVAMHVAIAPDGTTTMHHLSSAAIAASGDNTRIVTTSQMGTEVVELPSRRRWVHNIKNASPRNISTGPNGASLLERGADGTWWEWTLPPAGLALGALRRSATNAREQDDRVLLWPWQAPR